MERRKSCRLKRYDYNRIGGYFITICTDMRGAVLGRVTVGGGACDAPQVRLSERGRLVELRLRDMEVRYPHIRVKSYVVMPDHVHLILMVQDGTPQASSPTNAAIPQ